MLTSAWTIMHVNSVQQLFFNQILGTGVVRLVVTCFWSKTCHCVSFSQSNYSNGYMEHWCLENVEYVKAHLNTMRSQLLVVRDKRRYPTKQRPDLCQENQHTQKNVYSFISCATWSSCYSFRQGCCTHDLSFFYYFFCLVLFLSRVFQWFPVSLN